MPTVYLENHTVDFTPELWEFCKNFEFDPSMVPLILDSLYETIEFRNIPSENFHKAIVRWKRINRTQVREVIDLYFTHKIKNGRTAGWRTFIVMDTEAPIDSFADTHGNYFDLNGNFMKQGHVDLPRDVRDESADSIEACQNAFTFVQQVLRFSPEDLEAFEEELPIKEVKRHDGKKSKRKNKAPVIATTRTYRSYRIKHGYDFTDRNPIVRQCRLWIVRGHDRHLSDGRTVHIDPYYKGVDRKYAKPEDGNFGRQIKVKPISVNASETVPNDGKEGETHA